MTLEYCGTEDFFVTPNIVMNFFLPPSAPVQNSSIGFNP